jgi:Coiled-coil domain-containing protein 56
MSQSELKVKGLERKLKQSEIDFMKIIEEQNVKRVLKLKKTRKNNIITGNCGELQKFRQSHFYFFPAVSLGISVLGIYGYSMYAVQQEKFLDDFNEPIKEEIKQ